MTKTQLSKKADQFLALGVRLERLLNSLPPGVVNNSTNLKNELHRTIKSVERAAALAGG